MSKKFLTRTSIYILLTLLVASPLPQALAESKEFSSSLIRFSIEDLMNMTVSTANKRDSTLQDTASAVYVITSEEIRRSGLTSIPEILRLAPGVHVSSLNANSWAVGVRGHNHDFGNKLLALIDGREIYTPLFSGIFWDMHDYIVEDIDRIEVVRGPGATTWGSNAVNGVINIITKDSKSTRGSFISGLYGEEERWIGSARYGGTLGDKGDYRFYVRSVKRAERTLPGGSPGKDSLRHAQGGFRADFELSARDALTVQGDYIDGEGGQYCRAVSYLPSSALQHFPIDFTGQNILARWKRKYNESMEDSINFYWDNCKRLDAIHYENRTTFDLDIQRKKRFGNKHDLLFGLSGRRIDSDIYGVGIASTIAPSTTNNIFSFYVQDQISLDAKNTSLLLAGSKFERNSNTGLEIQPTIRYLKKIGQSSAWWSSISRAARTPSDGERYAKIYVNSVDLGLGLPVHAYLVGEEDFSSEYLTAYELGYRSQIKDNLSVDAAVFYNYYTDALTTEFGDFSIEVGPDGPYIFQPVYIRNNSTVRSYGGEISCVWLAQSNWKLIGSASYLNNRRILKPGINDSTLMTNVLERNCPKWQINLRSYFDLDNKTELDVSLFYTSRTFAHFAPNDVSPKARFDIRISRKLGNQSELTVGGRNLFRGKHLEYRDPLRTVATQLGPSFYVKYSTEF